MRVIAADVGGTKTLIALYERTRSGFVERRRRRYESGRFAGVVPMVREFLGEGAHGVRTAAFGVAGPVTGDTVRTTNLPWALDAREVEKALGIGRVRLVNDFEAAALGIGELDAGALEVLQDRPSDPGAPMAVLGAGTGLGEAIVFPNDGLPRVHPTEGGHTDFAPRDEIEIMLLRVLLKEHGRVSYEHVLSGRGLAVLYELVVRERLAETTPELAARYAEAEDKAAVIGEAAVAGSDPACVRAAAHFVSIYGAEAGNLALRTLPFGGLYVAGGIAPKLIDVIRGGEFLRAFNAKPPMEAILDRVRVSIVLDPCVGLLGARRLAFSLAA